jgi:hypothetical protein
MIRRILLAAVVAASLGACSHAQLNTAAAVQEKAETEAENLYVALATTINAYEQTDPSSVNRLEAIKLQAWHDLQIARAAYAAGQTVDTSLLATDAMAAKAATNATPN